MQSTSENKEKKVSIGVKIIAIIEFIFQGFALIGYLMILFQGDEILSAAKDAGRAAKLPATGIVVIAVLATIVIIVGCYMILIKKRVGVFIFFISVVITFILSILSGGFGTGTIISIILLMLMILFIKQDKEIFRI